MKVVETVEMVEAVEMLAHREEGRGVQMVAMVGGREERVGNGWRWWTMVGTAGMAETVRMVDMVLTCC